MGGMQRLPGKRQAVVPEFRRLRVDARQYYDYVFQYVGAPPAKAHRGI